MAIRPPTGTPWLSARCRHAGMGWPANAGGEHPDRETIYALPGVHQGVVLMLADSGRYWYGEARSRSPLVVWRALPRPERLPAFLGWNPDDVADECLNLWDEAHHDGEEWYTPLNELQFQKESGDQGFPGYSTTSARLSAIRNRLRSRFSQRGQTVRLLFPAWVPSDDVSRASEWVPEALQWDGVVLHAYGTAEGIRARYDAYRSILGPSVPILIGEWNGPDEWRTLSALADVARADPMFMGACYYIWETRNAGEGQLSVWGNDARLSLFEEADPGNPTTPGHDNEQPGPDASPPSDLPTDPPPPAVADLPTAAGPDPWAFWPAETIVYATEAPFESVEANWPKIVRQVDLVGLNSRAMQAAMIATVAIETASTFEPVREAFYLGEPEPAESYRRTLRYYPFYGRGFIQTTWRETYAATGNAIRALWGAGADDPTFDLIASPDNLLDPDMAAAALAVYVRDHVRSDGYTIAAAAAAGDWTAVRLLVQGGTAGLDRLVNIVTALGLAGADHATTLVYDPHFRAERQVQPWACSIRTAAWMLESVGVTADAGIMQSDMLAHGEVTPAEGLVDARGYPLAAALARHLPAGTHVVVLESPTFDDVMALAGRGPVAVGSTSLEHWLAVREPIDADTFSAMNPAPDYPASWPIGDVLTRAVWERWPVWSAVFIEVTPASPPAPPEEDANVIAELQAQVEEQSARIAALENLVGNAYNDDGQIIPVLRRIVEMKGADGKVMTKGGMQAEARGAIGFLTANRPGA